MEHEPWYTRLEPFKTFLPQERWEELIALVKIREEEAYNDGKSIGYDDGYSAGYQGGMYGEEI